MSFLTVHLLLRQNNTIEAVKLEENPEKCDVTNVIKIIRQDLKPSVHNGARISKHHRCCYILILIILSCTYCHMKFYFFNSFYNIMYKNILSIL